MPEASSRRRWLDKAVALAVYLALLSVGLLVCVELIARMAFGGPGQGAHQDRQDLEAYSYFDWRDAYFEDLAGGADFRALVYEPFSLWKHRDIESATVNVRDGYRVTWEPPPAPGQETHEIFTFGGSTLFGGEGPDDHTIPSYLAQQLAQEDPSTRYLVKNYGVSGFNSDNEVHLLVDLLRQGRRPRTVIFYDGANEVYNKVARGQPHYLYRNFAQLGRYSAGGVLTRLSRRFTLVELMSGGTKADDFSSDPEELGARAVVMLDEYLDNIELVRSLADRFGFDAYFFWQPSLFDTGKTLTQEERQALAAHAAVQPAFATVRELIDRRDALRSADVHDLRDALDALEESVFLDYCHVTALANGTLAERMLQALSPEPAEAEHH